MAAQPEPTAESLDAYWMPFTANRQFKGKPRMLSRASGMYYETPEGRKILDGAAGLWCVNAGHGRKEITRAVAEQLEVMDYAPPFQMGHPAAFELANAHRAHRARRASIMCSSPTRARSPSTPRSRSRWRITA